MRVVIGMLAVLGAGLSLVYFVGGYAEFDPAQAARQAKAALKLGMPFDDACEITGDPKWFHILNRKTRRVGTEEVVTMVAAPRVRCTRERINERLAEGSLPHGFLCTFRYAAAVSFTVKYDASGAVAEVGEDYVFATLLHGAKLGLTVPPPYPP